MPDEPKLNDLGSIWRNQPVAQLQVNLSRFMTRRASELEVKTRWEIVASIAAVLLFVTIFVWRVPAMQGWPQLLAFALAISWVLISAYRFRDRLRRRVPPEVGAVAAESVAFYRKQLQLRRDHLRNAWIWYGPVLLACVVVAITLGDMAMARPGRLWNILPFVLMLAAWMVMGSIQRRRQARAIQQEIDELGDA